MKKPKLKNCPFCGTVPAVRKNRDGFKVLCRHTSAGDPDMCAVTPSTLPCETLEAAAREWNTRKPQEGRGWHVNAWAVREMYLSAVRLFDIIKFYQGKMTPAPDCDPEVWRIEGEINNISVRLEELRGQLNTKGRR